ncbi:hypothetical protein niasHT_033689 [Heterodera trifolii]|uniref:Uncharacterized protein n=1 Tax=Heterodera trifolii TaxID=157864 RepID=A0ABD2I366_9BILA
MNVRSALWLCGYDYPAHPKLTFNGTEIVAIVCCDPFANNSCPFLLVRCPIARDASKWTKWEEEAINWRICCQRNRIDIEIYDENEIGDRLLDTTLGPSDQ